LHDGLVIFTGTTGAGKSSSMAALIQQMAERHRLHVLTIEEPIEYQFASRMGSLFSQREVGRDVPDFATGLKYGLRQDPDVILVGETRDRDTAQMVLSAAETGHLVLTTLHTRDAKGALSRFVDLFPAAQHEEARKLLAMSLRSVVSQHLLPGIGTSGRRVLATEVLHNSQQAEVAIRSGRFETLDSVIQTGRRDGMYTLDDDLERLVKAGKLPADVAQRLRKRSDGNSASRAGAWS
jgi:twitching motility protein PilT